MVSTDQLQELYSYDRWANERLWDVIPSLDDDQLNTDMHNGIGSILETLGHMVNGVWTWRTRWQGGMILNNLARADFPTLNAVHVRWLDEAAQVQDFLLHLANEDLQQEVRYVRHADPGKEIALPLWKSMFHLINHQTQHRSEIAMQLTALHHSPGELGMSNFFLR